MLPRFSSRTEKHMETQTMLKVVTPVGVRRVGHEVSAAEEPAQGASVSVLQLVQQQPQIATWTPAWMRIRSLPQHLLLGASARGMQKTTRDTSLGAHQHGQRRRSVRAKQQKGHQAHASL